MMKTFLKILTTEWRIARLRKAIRGLERDGPSLALNQKKAALLVQLQLNFHQPFGFKDMKQLAIDQLQKDLQTSHYQSKMQRVKNSRKTAELSHANEVK